MKQIPLTKGFVVLVDDEDFPLLSQWKWYAMKNGSGQFYAVRDVAAGSHGPRYRVFMHRALAETPEGMFTDHVNGNTLDNRRSNLRVATMTENAWNRAPNRKGSSKFKGVSWNQQKKKWVAFIQVNNRRTNLGYFHSEKEAAAAYADRAAADFGEFNREQTSD